MKANQTFRPLRITLIFWFLLLSIAPLTLIVGLSYHQANSSLTQAALNQLKQSSELNKRFINHWFYYRQIDLASQARSFRSINFLAQLVEKFNTSNKTIEAFVKNAHWYELVDNYQIDYIFLSRLYDYIDDIYLIDTQGNILFSVARLTDMGKNLAHKTLSETQFAKSVTTSLKQNTAIFSDMEFYAPNNNKLAYLHCIKTSVTKIIKGIFWVQLASDFILIS